jgi:thioredoxin-like negative regulator of GroEL
VILLSQFETLSRGYAGRVEFFKVDAGRNRKLLEDLDVRGVPTFLFYKGKKQVDMLVGGAVKIEQVEAAIKLLLT